MHTIRLVVPNPSNPTTPSPSHCLDTVISSLDSLASVVALCEWNDGVKRCVSEWRSENSFELDRCVSVIVHRGVVHLLDGPGSRSHLVGEDLVAAPDLLLELVHRDAAGACEAERERRDPGAQHLLPLFVFPFLRDRLEPETSLPRRYLRVPRVGWVVCDRRGRGVSSA